MKPLKTLVYILILFIATSSGLAAGDSSGDLKRSVALMAKIGACWSPSFSPDGKQIAFVSDLTGIPQIWTVSCSRIFILPAYKFILSPYSGLFP